MATWVRTGTGTSPSALDSAAPVTGNLSLDNATAPGDFDPAAVTSVRIQWRLSLTGTLNDDIWDDHQEVRLSNGATLLAAVNGANTNRTAVGNYEHDFTDSSPLTNQSTATWEGAVLSPPTTPDPGWADVAKTKGWDGSTATIPIANCIVTITYTPAAAAESVTVPITATTAVSDTVAYNESVSVAVTATIAVSDVDPNDIPFPPYIRQVKTATGDFGGTQDPSITLDTDPVVGNFLLGIYMGGGDWNQNANPPTGWTESVDNQGVDPPYYGQWIGYKTAVTSDAGPHTLDLALTDAGVFFIIELDSDYFTTDEIDSTIEWFQRTGTSENVTTWDPADSTLASTASALILQLVGIRTPVDTGDNAQTFSHSGTNTNTKIAEDAADSNDGANSTNAYSVGLFADEFSGSTTYDPGQFAWQDPFNSTTGYGRPHGPLIRIPITVTGPTYSESVTVAITGTVAVSDTVNLADSASVAVTGSVAVADTINFTDSVTVAITGGVTVNDTLTDVTFYDETGRSVAITSTVAATDAHGHNESVTVAITATVDVTDVLTDVTQYDETGRSVAITSSVTATDSKGMSESVSVAITSSVTSTDTANFTDSTTVAITGGVTVSDTYTGAQTFDETGRSVAITATVSATDAQGWNESVTVAVTSSVTSTDQASYTEATTASITSSVTATDTAAFTESTTVAITSSVAATEVYGRAESVTVPVTSTVSSTDTAAFTDSLTVNITGSVDVTDLYSQPGAFDETGRQVDITGSVGVADLLSATDTSAVAIVGTVNVQDQLAASESVAVGISSTVTVTDVFTGVGYTESLTVAVVATVAGTDALSSSDSTTVAVTAGVTSSDTHAMSESVSVDITAGVTVTDIDASGESVTVPITASVAVSDTYTPAPLVESVTVPITSSITSSDSLGMNESTLISIIGTVVVTDGHGYSESRLVAITGTVAASEQWTQRESILVDITSSISSLDILAAVESPSVDIIGTVIVSDGGAINESRTVSIIAVIEVNEQWYMLLPNQSDGPGRGTGATGPAYPGLRTPKGETDHANTVGKAE